MRVESYSALSARTSKSEREDALLFPRLGVLRGDPVRRDLEEGELNLEARASGEGSMFQMGSKTLAMESFVRPTIGESYQRVLNIGLAQEISYKP